MLVAGAESSVLQAVGSIGEAFAGAATTAGLFFAWRQILIARSQTRQTRAYAYYDQLTDIALIPLIAEAREFWHYGQEKGVRRGMRRWRRTSTEDRHRIVTPMNLIEEVGQRYLRGHVDEELVRTQFETAAVGWFREAKWFIDELRRESQPGEPPIYDKWEAMVRDFGTPPAVPRWPAVDGLFDPGAHTGGAMASAR